MSLFFRKKKKNKNKDKNFLEQIDMAVEQKLSEKSNELKLTKAEKAFFKQQERLVNIFEQ